MRPDLPPIPVLLLARAFPAVPPRVISLPVPLGDRVVIADAAVGPDGRAISGTYVGDGPDMEDIGGRFLGPAAPQGFEPPGDGPLRTLPDFLDRVLWRPAYRSRLPFVTWDSARFFCSLAHAFRKGGLWVVLFTDMVDGRQLVDLHRSPIVLGPQSDGRVRVWWGPRKYPDPRDFDESGRQYPGKFPSLRDAVSALVGERVDDLAMGCRLFDVPPPPPGPASVESLPERIVALRHLYRAVRAEAESWPGVGVDRLPSATAIVSGAYLSAGIPQPMLRDRRTMRVPPRAIGAGIEAASIGARTGLFVRRVALPGVDVDITACYPVGAALAGVQDFLTHEVTAHHQRGRRSVASLTRAVREAVG